MKLQRLTSVAIWRTRSAGIPLAASSAILGLYPARDSLQKAHAKAAFSTIDRLHMQSFLTTCAVIGALGLAACGSPSELDEDSFPAPDQTGYAMNGSGGGTVVVGGQAGSSGVAASGGSTAISNGGGAQTGGSNAGSGSTVMNTASGCPQDITVLFNRPSTQGGCASGGGCHDGAVMPDLVSPNVLSRLLNVASSCTKSASGATVPARPYIGKDDSFLEEKIAGSPTCGNAMPFFMVDKLSANDRQCIVDWIDSVKGG